MSPLLPWTVALALGLAGCASGRTPPPDVAEAGVVESAPGAQEAPGAADGAGGGDVSAAAPVQAPEPPEDGQAEVPGGETTPSGAGPTEAAEAAIEAAREQPTDPCDASYLDADAWIDRMHRRLLRTTCESALWFDNLFSNERIYEERQVTTGRLALGAAWDEREGTEPITRFRLKYRLPAFERRINAIVGRGDEDQVITDRGSIGDRVPVYFGDPEEDEWLLGLGYSPTRGRNSRFSAGVGVRVGLPSEPYVKVGYRNRTFINHQSLVRYRQTVFWESRDGAGTTTRVDVEKILAPDLLIRWRNTGTVSEVTEGVDWRTTISLFQKVGRSRGVAYQVGVSGETDAEVTIRDAGFRVIYRQPIFREWLFIDLRPALDWRKETQLEQRKPIWGLGAAIEMRFGHRLR